MLPRLFESRRVEGSNLALVRIKDGKGALESSNKRLIRRGVAGKWKHGLKPAV